MYDISSRARVKVYADCARILVAPAANVENFLLKVFRLSQFCFRDLLLGAQASLPALSTSQKCERVSVLFARLQAKMPALPATKLRSIADFRTFNHSRKRCEVKSINGKRKLALQLVQLHAVEHYGFVTLNGCAGNDYEVAAHYRARRQITVSG